MLARKPRRVRLRQQTVSCSDIRDRCLYVLKCLEKREQVDMRQLLNIVKLTEMYNNALSKHCVDSAVLEISGANK